MEHLGRAVMPQRDLRPATETYVRTQETKNKTIVKNRRVVIFIDRPKCTLQDWAWSSYPHWNVTFLPLCYTTNRRLGHKLMHVITGEFIHHNMSSNNRALACVRFCTSLQKKEPKNHMTRWCFDFFFILLAFMQAYEPVRTVRTPGDGLRPVCNLLSCCSANHSLSCKSVY